ncbi:glycoside hydrolase family 3 C-terminal domain-containing protein [Actinophytocola sp.]|uniref:glycoside hydrolase family 3 C-terminal domain-containing protein n=1 Tax=Actinophytocola sp. TaxID=1872138 RepID=UPI0025C275FA|nr:glycoside hydrolase family 3 C-terminal domain-containing protein [Actinophytocola sp.]
MRTEELRRLVGKLDLDQKVRLLTGATQWRIHAEPAIGLRPVVMSDGPVGVRGERWDERDTSLVLPSPTALAATWSPELVARLGGLLAAEARRKGVDVLLAPTLNLHRSPVGGRHFECYSEDPWLTAWIGAAYVRGVQAGGVAATAKHYVANDSETERMTLDAAVDERVLREVYLVPFEAAVAAGVWAVMSAYNGVNGAPMSENPLLADPLKGEWGFTGPVVSDWGAVRSTMPSARAAQDLVMPGPRGPWGDALAAAVRSGEIMESTVDDKVERLLRLADLVGALGSPRPRPDLMSTMESELALLRTAVASSAVLVRNEGVLPVDPTSVRRVAVLGWNAVTARIQGGGSAGVYPAAPVSPLDGIRAALAGTADVVHAVGAYPSESPTPLDPAYSGDPVSGEPGVLVRLLDAGGGELHAERRLSGRILEPARVSGAVTVEIQALLRPPSSGEWRLAVGGWGPVSLTADGRPLVDEDIAVDTDDPATMHLAPAFRAGMLRVTEGEEVHLVARRSLVPGTGVATLLAADPPRRGAVRELTAAVELAQGADLAVVVVGTTDEIESEGFDRTSLALPGAQDELVRAVAAANPNTVVIVNSGGPVLLPWREEVPAVLLSWFPGEQAGHGLADVLFGAAEPGGRLPTTWAAGAADVPVLDTRPVDGVLRYAEGLDIGYRAWLGAGSPPAYWFGHGLGYTTWSYEDISVSEPDGHACSVRIRVRNTGSRPGREVVQVYLSRSDGTVARPPRWLAGFTAVTAAPGGVVDAVVDVPARMVEHWTPGGWAVEPGEFAVHAGRSAGDLPLSARMAIGG